MKNFLNSYGLSALIICLVLSFSGCAKKNEVSFYKKTDHSWKPLKIKANLKIIDVAQLEKHEVVQYIIEFNNKTKNSYLFKHIDLSFVPTKPMLSKAKYLYKNGYHHVFLGALGLGIGIVGSMIDNTNILWGINVILGATNLGIGYRILNALQPIEKLKLKKKSKKMCTFFVPKNQMTEHFNLTLIDKKTGEEVVLSF